MTRILADTRIRGKKKNCGDLLNYLSVIFVRLQVKLSYLLVGHTHEDVDQVSDLLSYT